MIHASRKRRLVQRRWISTPLLNSSFLINGITFISYVRISCAFVCYLRVWVYVAIAKGLLVGVWLCEWVCLCVCVCKCVKGGGIFNFSHSFPISQKQLIEIRGNKSISKILNYIFNFGCYDNCLWCNCAIVSQHVQISDDEILSIKWWTLVYFL